MIIFFLWTPSNLGNGPEKGGWLVSLGQEKFQGVNILYQNLYCKNLKKSQNLF
jgi:hypothetical protein